MSESISFPDDDFEEEFRNLIAQLEEWDLLGDDEEEE